MRNWRRRDRPAGAAPPTATSEDAARWGLVGEALELVQMGVLVQDASGATVLSNARAATPLGELTGDTLADVALRRALLRARSGHAAVELVDVAGPQRRQLEVTATPLRSGGVVATVIDNTERVRLEAVRRDFVANVNHELRTPIGALTVLAEALGGEHDSATVERLTNRIQAEAERASALIDDLLDFARVEIDNQPRHQQVSLADVIEVAAGRVSAAAARRRIRLHIDAHPDATVIGDHEQLVVAVANLLDNAIKYSGEGAAVEVATHLPGAGNTLKLTVQDHGIGIPARDLDRVFERFYRVDNARDRRTGGTGLGLAIVRHVAANHGGEITVESEEGSGSTFTLRLPSVAP